VGLGPHLRLRLQLPLRGRLCLWSLHLRQCLRGLSVRAADLQLRQHSLWVEGVHLARLSVERPQQSVVVIVARHLHGRDVGRHILCVAFLLLLIEKRLVLRRHLLQLHVQLEPQCLRRHLREGLYVRYLHNRILRNGVQQGLLQAAWGC